jgi:hypothetical protein
VNILEQESILRAKIQAKSTKENRSTYGNLVGRGREGVTAKDWDINTCCCSQLRLLMSYIHFSPSKLL